MSNPEHDEQVAVVRWFRMAYPRLVIFAIPNAAKRSPQLANYMKAEGLLPGVSDLFVMQPNKTKHGLFIEMKSKKGKLSEQQEYFLKLADEKGYATCVCYGADEAMAAIVRYLGE